MILAKTEQTNLKIFKAIAIAGKPTTAYDLTKKGFDIATAIRHLRKMDAHSIIPYSEKNTGGKRKRNPYGPTFWGVTEACAVDHRFQKNLEQVFEKWYQYEEFRTECSESLLDEKTLSEEPEKAKKYFKELIIYFARTVEEYYKLSTDPCRFSAEMMVNIGHVILEDDKKHQQDAKRLYSNLPMFKKEWDASFVKDLKRRMQFTKLKKKSALK